MVASPGSTPGQALPDWNPPVGNTHEEGTMLPPATLPPYERLRRLDVATMLQTPAPTVPWVVEGVCARGYLTMIAGKAGEGKSLFTQALADAVAGGESLAGMRVPTAGRVVIIDAENGEGEIHRRVKTLALGGQLGLDERAPDRISVYEAQGLDLLHDLGVIQDVLRLERPALLILDSWRSLWSGSEHSRYAATLLHDLRALLARYECAGILLHHLTKYTRTLDVRGSSMVLGEPEVILVYARVPGDPEPGRRFMACQKNRLGGEPAPRWLRIAQEGGMLVVDQCEAYEPGKAQPPRPVRDRLLESVYWTLYTSEDGLLRAEVARRVERDARDRSVGRCLDELVAAGRVTRDGLVYRVAEVATPAAEVTAA